MLSISLNMLSELQSLNRATRHWHSEPLLGYVGCAPTSTSQGAPTVPSTTFLEIPPAEQVQMRAVLRRTRYGYLLAFHLLLLCAAGRNPTEIAAFLLCSRSSVYRIVHAYRTGSLGIRIDQEGQCSIAVQSTICRCFRAVDRLPSHR